MAEAITSALHAGVPWAELWTLTPYAIGLIWEAYVQRTFDAYDIGTTTAYRVEIFNRTRGRLPEIADLLIDRTKRHSPPQSQAEIRANFRLFMSRYKRNRKPE